MADPTSDDPFHLCGHTIEGKYRIASVVGDGGFGVVYRAVHKGFGELIAVKCLKMPTSLDAQQRDDLLETLRDEGRILHRLSRATSGIVQALDVGAFVTDAGAWVPFLVLEWLEGETLAHFMRGRSDRGEGGMAVGDAMKLLEPAARALAVAHGQKVAHRDVKPANLFLTDVGGARTIKVLDFGIAKVLADYPSFTQALEATKQGPSAFTPRYGAPEQFNKARGATGPWTDVFALALIFVELVSGKRALEGDDPTQLYVASADPTMRPTPRGRGFDAGDAVEQVLEKALAIEPKHRFPSAGEFWDALVAAAARPGRPAARAAGGEAAAEPDAMLSTADFAAAKKLDVPTEPPVSEARPGDPTMPAESLPPLGSRRVPVRVSPREPDAGAAPAAATRAKGAGVEDSMAETPPVYRGRAGPAAEAEKARAAAPQKAEAQKADAPQKPAPQQAEAGETTKPRAQDGGGARGILPWFFGALVLGLGALGIFVLQQGDRPQGRTAPTASQKAGGAGSARATAASASAAAQDAAAQDAAPEDAAAQDAAPAAPAGPPVPPEDMVYFPPVSATIGAGAEARQVTLARGFFLDRNEVTVRAYQACLAQRQCSAADHVALVPEQPASEIPGQPENPSAKDYAEVWTRRCNEPRKALDHPINCVDFSNAEGYCRFRGRRLPTEAEWEIAARGADGRVYPWGAGAPTCERACFDRNGACRPRGAEVATCAAGTHASDRTPEGVYDLGGNVAEWTADGLVFPPPGGADPKGDPAAALRVVRGGSFLDEADRLGATFRAGVAPVTAHVAIGLRCAMDVPGAGEGAEGAP